MLEYVLLDNINDSKEHAEELIKIVKNIPVKFNLIPFNSWPGCGYKASSNNRIHKFSEILFNAGIEAPIRKTRGDDILAACGQLKSFLTEQKIS
jgi:23S rRNA (adenine2503-C2)-methyltransferase